MPTNPASRPQRKPRPLYIVEFRVDDDSEWLSSLDSAPFYHINAAIARARNEALNGGLQYRVSRYDWHSSGPADLLNDGYNEGLVEAARIVKDLFDSTTDSELDGHSPQSPG